jgi:hypothetical protein
VDRTALGECHDETDDDAQHHGQFSFRNVGKRRTANREGKKL